MKALVTSLVVSGVLATSLAACGPTVSLGTAADGGSDTGARSEPDSGMPSEPDSAAPAASDGGTDGPTGVDAQSPSPCPAATPNAGDACANADLVCEYGSDPSVGCDTVVTCSGGVWALTPIKTNDISLSCSTAPNPSACPAAFGDVPVDAVCGSQGSPNTSCDYPEARCVCGQFKSADSNYYWNCDSLTAPESYCPTLRPRLGAACASATPTCDYGSCSYEGGIAMQCSGSVWVTVPGPTCPLP